MRRVSKERAWFYAERSTINKGESPAVRNVRGPDEDHGDRGGGEWVVSRLLTNAQTVQRFLYDGVAKLIADDCKQAQLRRQNSERPTIFAVNSSLSVPPKHATAAPANPAALKEAAVAASPLQQAQYAERHTRHGVVKCYREFVIGPYRCHHFW